MKLDVLRNIGRIVLESKYSQFLRSYWQNSDPYQVGMVYGVEVCQL